MHPHLLSSSNLMTCIQRTISLEYHLVMPVIVPSIAHKCDFIEEFLNVHFLKSHKQCLINYYGMMFH